jgi:microcystin-dependent protein
MSEPFLGEIKLVAFNFPPRGWATCDGQVLSISQNQALFAILGTTYGGNGMTTFALPDLRGRVPFHMGTNQGGSYALGQSGGEATHTLTTSELPPHSHVPGASQTATQVNPLSGVFANGGELAYSSTAASPTLLNPASVQPSGGSLPHENMSPYLTVNFIIALQGIFPSRN